MAYRMKKPPMRIVVSIVAVLLVAVAVPISTAFADGMNGMIGGDAKEVFKADKIESFESTVPIRTGEAYAGYADDFMFLYGQGKYAPQTVYTSTMLGESLNHVVLVQRQGEEFVEEGQRSVFISLAYSPADWIADGISSVDLTLTTAVDKILVLNSKAYSENSATLQHKAALMFHGVTPTGVKTVTLPVTVTSSTVGAVEAITDGYEIHLEADNETTFNMELENAMDILRANEYLKSCSNIAMSLCIVESGTETPNQRIQLGDDIGFMVSIKSKAVSGYSISNIFVGIVGVSLIVGAVFATPWVGKNTFSRDGRLRRRNVKNRRW